MTKPTVLFVDDERNWLDSWENEVIRRGLNGSISSFFTQYLHEALEYLDANRIDVLVTDFKLSGRDIRQILPADCTDLQEGLYLIRKVREKGYGTFVVFISTYGDMEDARQAIIEGGGDKRVFVVTRKTKEESGAVQVVEHLRSFLQEINKRPRLIEDSIANARELLAEPRHREYGIVGRSDHAESIRREIRQAADDPVIPVLIEGMSGTGKELAAQAIHYETHQTEERFRVVHCSEKDGRDLDIELGGFPPTRENPRMWGVLEIVTSPQGIGRNTQPSRYNTLHGTIMLDEIDALPQNLMNKFNRALDRYPYSQLNSNLLIQTSNIRFISASKCCLRLRVQKEEFGSDTYARICGIYIQLLPLRERREDIPLLVCNFLTEQSRTRGRNFDITQEALRMLVNRDWPFNIRELKLYVEGLILDLGNIDLIEAKHLNFHDNTLDKRIWTEAVTQGADSLTKEVVQVPIADLKDGYVNLVKNPHKWLEQAAGTTIRELGDRDLVGKILTQADGFGALARYVRGEKIWFSVSGSYYLLRHCDPIEFNSHPWVEGLLFLQFWNVVSSSLGGVEAVINPKNGTFNFFCIRSGEKLVANTVSGHVRETKKFVRTQEEQIRSAVGDYAGEILDKLVGPKKV